MTRTPPEKSREVVALKSRARTVRVAKSRSHDLTTLESHILASRALQRLRNLRQTGLAFVEYPTAEHSRLSHSLGTSYWAVRMLEGIRQGEARRDDRPGLLIESLDDDLGPEIDLELLLRAFALIHDFALLPFGHTLGYQLGYVDTSDSAFCRRFEIVLKRLLDEVASVLPGDRVRDCLIRHLELAGVVACGSATLQASQPRGLELVRDLIMRPVSADLFDFVERDLVGASLGYDMLSEHALHCIVAMEDLQGRCTFAFDVSDLEDPTRTEVIASLASALKARHLILVQIAYSHRKLVADSMLDKALSLVMADNVFNLEDEELLRLGDEEFLARLEHAEVSALGKPGPGAALVSGQLFAEVFRLGDWSRLSDRGRKLVEKCLAPSGRRDVEALIAAAIPSGSAGDIVVSVRPERMQSKDAGVGVLWAEGSAPISLDVAAQYCGGQVDVPGLGSYESERSMSVYVGAGVDPSAASAAASLVFEGGEEGR